MMIDMLELGFASTGIKLLAGECRSLLDAQDGEIHEINDIRTCLTQIPHLETTLMALVRCVPEKITGIIVKREAPGEPVSEIWVTLAHEPSDPSAHFVLVHRTGTPVSDREKAQRGLQLLVEARELFKDADNKKTVERIRSAISSAKGAIRIQQGRAIRRQLDAA